MLEVDVRIDNKYFDKCLPYPFTLGSEGIDLLVNTESELIIQPKRSKEVGCGIYLAIPRGFFGILCLRSFMEQRGLVLTNSVGIIDSDYRDEIVLSLYNRAKNLIVLKPDQRVAQLIIVSHHSVLWNMVDNLEPESRTGED